MAEAASVPAFEPSFTVGGPAFKPGVEFLPSQSLSLLSELKRGQPEAYLRCRSGSRVRSRLSQLYSNLP